MRRIMVALLLVFSYGASAQYQSLTLVQQVMDHFNKGEYAKAIPVAEKAVDVTKNELGENSPFHSGMMLFLAVSHWNLYHYAETEKWLLRHHDLTLKYTGERTLDYIAAVNRLAQLYQETGKYQQSESAYNKSLSISKAFSGGNDTIYAKSLNNMALLYQSLAQYSKAEQLYVQSRDLLKRITGEQSIMYVTTLNNLATLYSDQGYHEKAKPLLLRVLELRKTLLGEYHADYAQALNNMGFLYSLLGQYREAETSYTRARDIYRQTLGEKHPEYASSISNLAELYVTTGDYQRAEQLYNQALQIRKNSVGENHPDYALSLNNLATMNSTMGRYDLAEKLLLESTEKNKKALGENHPAYATSLNNLAAHYHSRGQYVKAEPLYQLAKETRRKILGEQHPKYAMSINNLAVLYHEMGQYEKAEQQYLQAAAIWKKSLGAQHTDYAMCQNNLAAVYEDQGLYSKAEPLYILAKDIRKAVYGENHNEYAISLNNLSGLYAKMGQYAKAETLILQANTIWKKILNDDNPNIALGQNNLAAVYRKAQIKLPEAEKLYLQSIDRRKRVLGENHPLTADTENDLALLYMNLKQYQKAEPLFLSSSRKSIQNLLNAFPVLSDKEKALFINENIFFNDCNNSFLVNCPVPTAAMVTNSLDLQLAFKSLSLADTRNMLETVRSSSDATLKKLLSDWETARSILSAQYALPAEKRMKTLAQKETETENLEKELNRRSADFRRQQTSLRVTMKDVQQKLADDEVAVEFIRFHYFDKKFTDSMQYAAYVFNKKDAAPSFIPLFEEKQLQKILDSAGKTATQLVSSFYRGADTRSKSSAGALGERLYKLVWQPLEPKLKEAKKISYSPAGKLYSIAFHALPADSSKILMDKYGMQQLTSTRQVALKESNKNNAAPQSIILFGDARFTMDSLQIVRGKTRKEFASPIIYTAQSRGSRGGVWVDLPGTAQEVKAIQQLFAQNKTGTKIFTQTDATEENFKSLSGKSPQVLHIATHGFFLPENSSGKKEAGASAKTGFVPADDPLLRSGLILAGGNYAWSGKTPIDGVEDGIVTAYEISQLNLSNTELVVLSACETALGDVKGSEGVFGLQRAFKMAGVKKMIVSLWQVPDKETAELMTSFYGYWFKGKTIEEAFAQAQADMRKKYPPYYWAAFVLVE